MISVIQTPRLILRLWEQGDRQPFFLINQDPQVVAFLRGTLTQEQVNDFMVAANAHQDRHGYTLWAVELKETGQLIGFVGLNYTDWPAHFTPAVEIGWRLGSQYWGQGYATEAAKACLKYAFDCCQLNEIVSFTVPANLNSIKVMQRIGLSRDPHGDFAHPKLPVDHPLSHHVLYRLTAQEYRQQLENNPSRN